MQWSDFIGFHGGRSCLTKWNVTKFLYSVTAFFVPANTLYCSLNYIGKISDWICKFLRPTLAHDILQTPIVLRDQVPLITCPSLFQVILTTQIWVGSRLFHPQKSFCKVLSVHLLFLENVNLNLTCERHSKSLYWLWNASALSSISSDCPIKWTVFFMNQLKIIKSISSASLTSKTFIFGGGSGIMNHES